VAPTIKGHLIAIKLVNMLTQSSQNILPVFSNGKVSKERRQSDHI
jgi:hypothetical protein